MTERGQVFVIILPPPPRSSCDRGQIAFIDSSIRRRYVKFQKVVGKGLPTYAKSFSFNCMVPGASTQIAQIVAFQLPVKSPLADTHSLCHFSSVACVQTQKIRDVLGFNVLETRNFLCLGTDRSRVWLSRLW